MMKLNSTVYRRDDLLMGFLSNEEVMVSIICRIGMF